MKQDTHYAPNPYSLYIRLGKKIVGLATWQKPKWKNLCSTNTTPPNLPQIG